jgi:hypothetical protein
MHRCLTLFVVLIALGSNSGCGGGYGGSSGGGASSATITDLVSAVKAGASYTFTATTPSTNGYTSGISWTLSPATGAGTLSNVTNSGYSSSVVYMAPASAPSPNSVTITATPADTAVAPATDTFTIGSSTTPYAAMLSGLYAFEVSGFDASGEPSSIVGSITSDGFGNITEGALDMNQGSAVTVRRASLAGTYTLDSNMRGLISLSTVVPGASHPLAFAFTLVADANSGVLAGSDANGFHISGTLHRQDSAAFSLAKISGDFAFKLESNSPSRVVTAGRFTIGENSNILGLADSSTTGRGLLLAAAPAVGRITAAPDANGRGTLTLTASVDASRFAYYVISEKSLLLIETASANAGSARQIGVAERQVMPFSPATANAASLLRAVGFDGQASSSGLIAVTGKLSIENFTHATLDWTANVADSILSEISLRSELVTFDPATGRGTIKIANGYANNFADSVAFYLVGPGKGFFLDTTEGRFNRAMAGDFRPVTPLAEPIAVSSTTTSHSQ